MIKLKLLRSAISLPHRCSLEACLIFLQRLVFGLFAGGLLLGLTVVLSFQDFDPDFRTPLYIVFQEQSESSGRGDQSGAAQEPHRSNGVPPHEIRGPRTLTILDDRVQLKRVRTYEEIPLRDRGGIAVRKTSPGVAGLEGLSKLLADLVAPDTVHILYGDVAVEMGSLSGRQELRLGALVRNSQIEDLGIMLAERPRGPPTLGMSPYFPGDMPTSMIDADRYRPLRKVYVVGEIISVKGPLQLEESLLRSEIVDLNLLSKTSLDRFRLLKGFRGAVKSSMKKFKPKHLIRLRK